jgi:hypothetical protein
MNTRLANNISLAAFITGVMAIVGLIAIILFFGLEAPTATANSQQFHFWGTLSDVSAPLTMIPLLVVILALHRFERSRAPVFSQVAAIVGVVGALGVTILQVLLIARVLSFEQEVGPVVVANGVVGVWQILANYLARLQQVLPSRLAWLGLAVGVAEALYPVLFQILGGASFYSTIGSNYVLLTLTGVIFLVSYVGFPIWAIWLGRALSRTPVESTLASNAPARA